MVVRDEAAKLLDGAAVDERTRHGDPLELSHEGVVTPDVRRVGRVIDEGLIWDRRKSRLCNEDYMRITSRRHHRKDEFG